MPTQRERFDDKVSMEPMSGCWLWTGSLDRQGYGRFGKHRGTGFAHRAAWAFHRGEIPVWLYVCHSCDNPACVNPSHLFLGTPLDNQRDCIAKGRQATPAAKRCAKLTEDDVIAIRSIFRGNKTTQAEVAKMFGVSQPTITRVLARETWASV